MTPLGLIPFVVFLCATAAIGAVPRHGDEPARLREPLLWAAVLCSVWTVLGTELLSLFSALAAAGVLAWWAVPAGPLIGVLVRHRRRVAAWAGALRPSADLRPLDWLLAGLIAAIMAPAAAAAVLSPPNAADALGYHLPRQLYWIQHRAVVHYPTFDLRELMMPPLAEFFGVHHILLAGDDQFVNLVQWLAGVLALVAISLVVRSLGGGTRAQLAAPLFAAANPMFYLQASSAKNDLVLTLWLAMLAWLMLRVWNARRCDWADALLIGAVLGLAALTKGTAPLFALPFCLLIGALMLAFHRAGGLARGAAVALVAIAVVAGHSWRNLDTFGSPLGPADHDGGYALSNTLRTPAAVASNVIRNLSLHAAGLPQPAIDRVVSAVEHAHGWLGLDANDPRTTWHPTRFPGTPAVIGEGSAAAPAHVLAFAAAGVLALAWHRGRPSFRAAAVSASLIAGFLLFCTVLKWQPWHARFHLPLVTLACAPIACLGGPSAVRRLGGGAFLLGALAALAPAVLWNADRPLLTDRSIFVHAGTRALEHRDRDVAAALPEVVAELRRLAPAHVRLQLTGPFDYVVMRAIRRGIDPPPWFSEIGDRTRRGDRAGDHPPDLILTYGQDRPLLRDPHSRAYFEPAARIPPFTIYEPSERDRRLPGEPAPAGGLFVNVEPSEGLSELQRPFGRLPARRTGYWPATRLHFESGSQATLILRCAPAGPECHGFAISINGVEFARRAFEGEDFQNFEFRIPAVPGTNELVIAYHGPTGGQAPPPGAEAAHFAWLQVHSAKK